MAIGIKYRRVHTYAELPKKSTTGAACYDVFLPCTYEPLNPGEIRIIKLGFELEIPNGWQVNIRSRSGLASKGILVANSVGIVDSKLKLKIGVIKSDELLEKPEVVNQQPSVEKDIKVSTKVQRLEGEESTNNPSTSVRQHKIDIAMDYILRNTPGTIYGKICQELMI